LKDIAYDIRILGILTQASPVHIVLDIVPILTCAIDARTRSPYTYARAPFREVSFDAIFVYRANHDHGIETNLPDTREARDVRVWIMYLLESVSI
jgi:hypothetical protein